jgi:hypothetical protein
MSYPDYFQDPYRHSVPVSDPMEELQHRYRVLREQFSGLDRYSIALYQPYSRRLTTFDWGGEVDSPLNGYSVPIDQVPGLKLLATAGNLRVINDMRSFRQEGMANHSAALLGQGFRSSLTMPLMYRDQWLGLLFLNSRQMDYFNRSVVVYCSLWSHWIAEVLGAQWVESRQLLALAESLSGDPLETAEPVSALVHLMGCSLLSEHQLDDQEVHYLALHAPLYLAAQGIPEAMQRYISGRLPFGQWFAQNRDDKDCLKRQLIEAAQQLWQRLSAQRLESDDHIRELLGAVGKEAEALGFMPQVQQHMASLQGRSAEITALLAAIDEEMG